MFSGTAARELLPVYVLTNPNICSSPGQLVVQKELSLTGQKVDGLMQCVLTTGSELWLFHGQEKKKGKKL